MKRILLLLTDDLVYKLIVNFLKVITISSLGRNRSCDNVEYLYIDNILYLPLDCYVGFFVFVFFLFPQKDKDCDDSFILFT